MKREAEVIRREMALFGYDMSGASDEQIAVICEKMAVAARSFGYTVDNFAFALRRLAQALDGGGKSGVTPPQ